MPTFRYDITYKRGSDGEQTTITVGASCDKIARCQKIARHKAKWKLKHKSPEWFRACSEDDIIDESWIGENLDKNKTL
jgi:hypothetical protein